MAGGGGRRGAPRLHRPAGDVVDRRGVAQRARLRRRRSLRGRPARGVGRRWRVRGDRRGGVGPPEALWSTRRARPPARGSPYAGGAAVRGRPARRAAVARSPDRPVPVSVGTPEALFDRRVRGRLARGDRADRADGIDAVDEAEHTATVRPPARRATTGSLVDPRCSPTWPIAAVPGSAAVRSGCHAARATLGVDHLHRERGSCVSDGQNGPVACAGSGGRHSCWPPSSWRWCGWSSRSASGSLESLGLLAHANWWWVGAAVIAQAVSMGAMARQQRRLLGVGGSRMSLAGVRGDHLRRQRHLRRAAAGRPGRRHAVRDAAVRRPRRGGVRRRVGAGRLRGVLVVRAGRGGRARGGGVRLGAGRGLRCRSACSAAPCRWRCCCCRCAARDRGGCSRSWGRGWSRACRRSAASRRATPRRSSRSSWRRSRRWSRTGRRCGSRHSSRR